ncbi:hypothetical protein SBOR_9036 [Sclerotinia borealis F-4128]|uniref:HORMA domain-containing protein n=1 Tax=Sclerotinia borealis (strain F-4128) TaxID=1432307 RepID=W9C7M2_SCLBF|nr:hypothetical protein SBOR_9036 [Sclerotinia borealis F-4128]
MPAPPPPLSTPHSLHAHLLNFLTLSIHTILYTRSLYPRTTFLMTRAFNYPVPQNRHPELCSYVNSCVSSLVPYLRSGSIASVAVVVYCDGMRDDDGKRRDDGKEIRILERYIFDISRFPAIPPSENLTEFEDRAGGDKDDVRNVDVEEELRAVLRKLAYSAGKLEELKDPEECTWGLVMEMKEDEEWKEVGNAPIRHPQVFEPAVPELQVPDGRAGIDVKGKGKAKAKEDGMDAEGEVRPKEKMKSRVGSARGGIKSTAIRAVEVGEFIMEAWIEEGKAKFENWGEHEHEHEYEYE